VGEPDCGGKGWGQETGIVSLQKKTIGNEEGYTEKNNITYPRIPRDERESLCACKVEREASRGQSSKVTSR